ncbi:MAG TPA: TetR/AcrR family transcriptional regulator [Steroidobacteraceae bacterium]|nr:TetR/AcrR family transcriptional regulator [Steroidobacteraceae bacterium]
MRRAPAAPSPWKPRHERARDRAAKREAVIAAAARVFRTRGYHNTTLDDIAASLHVTKPTLYYYLTSKEHIVFECYRAGIGRITAALAELVGSPACGRDKLATLVRRYAEVMATDFGWCMVRVEDEELSEAMARRIRKLKSGIDQGIRTLLRDGMRDGSIASCDPKMTAFALAGALNWIGHWYRAEESLTPDEIAERFNELFARGLAPRRA